jgi:hypothetical protein
MILVPAGIALLGVLATLLLPEPKGQSLEAISQDPLLGRTAQPARIARAAHPTGA